MPARILYMIPELRSGGAESQMLELVRGLNKGRFLPFVCSLWPPAGLTDEIVAAGAELVPVHKRNRFDLSFIFRMAAWMRAHHMDIVHTYLFTANTWGRLAACLARTPCVIVSERSAWIEGSEVEKAAHRMVNRVLAPLTDLILANSRAVQVRMEHELWWSPGCMVIRNCVDIDRFKPALSPDDAARLKAALGIPPEAKVVGTVARVSAEKDYPPFLRPMRLVLDQSPGLAVLAVGGGPLRGDMEVLASTLGLTGHVVFTGEQDKVERCYAAMDVFVLTSLFEGLPNVVLEAMSCGRPVVATSVCGTPELVAHGETGFLVPAGDAKAVADAVLGLLEDPGLALAMGRAGRLRIEHDFTKQKMVQATQAVYEGLMAGGRCREH